MAYLDSSRYPMVAASILGGGLFLNSHILPVAGVVKNKMCARRWRSAVTLLRSPSSQCRGIALTAIPSDASTMGGSLQSSVKATIYGSRRPRESGMHVDIAISPNIGRAKKFLTAI